MLLQVLGVVVNVVVNERCHKVVAVVITSLQPVGERHLGFKACRLQVMWGR